VGGLTEGQPSGRPAGWLAREPEATPADVITADQDGTVRLVAPTVRVGRGGIHHGDGVHGLTPFGCLGSIPDQRDGLPLLGTERVPQGVGLLAECRFRSPPLNPEAVGEAGPVGLSVQLPIQVGHLPPSPHTGTGEDQQAKGGDMIPVKMPPQGLQNLVKAGGHVYDAEQETILLIPPACGRWVRS